MENTFEDKFTRPVYYDETITTKPDKFGYFFRATIKPDEGMGAPWDEHDGHGVVTDWRNKDTKGPGERILCEDSNPYSRQVRFYDVQESTKLAKEDGWGCGKKDHTHKTRGEEIACAVQQDFEYLRRWCNDDWTWVGVVLSLHREDAGGNETTIDENLGSIWGIDSDSADHLTDTANDLLQEAQQREDVRKYLNGPQTVDEALAFVEDELNAMYEYPESIGAHVAARLSELGFQIIKTL